MARREAFDPLRSYVANRDFSWKGRAVKQGEPFDERTDMRRLRQLYDSRHLRMSEVDNGAPTFKVMKEDELREWLVANGRPMLAHPRATRQRLLERCQRRWLELKAEADSGVTTRHDDPQGDRTGVQGPAAARDLDEERPLKRERLR